MKPDRVFFIAGFSLLMISALLVRTIAAQHGLPYIYNYDEPITAGTALHMMKTGDFNPHMYNYGSLLIYLYYIIDVIDFFWLVGRPETAPSYLTSLKDIHVGVVGIGDDWLWQVSHPSFYLLNRMFSVVLNLLSIVFTYFLAKHITGGKWCALVAVAFLTSLSVFVEHAAYTTPDGPATCFVMGAVLFACLFHTDGELNKLLWSLVFCGLAAATKYNTALVVIVPLAALTMRLYSDRQFTNTYWIIYIFCVPLFVFLICIPYSILDSVTFLEDVGSVIRNYKVEGHGSNSSVPGVNHLLFQFDQFYGNIGLGESLVILTGFGGLFAYKKLRLAIIFPIIYMIYSTQMKVNFHRNFLLIYPFASVLLAVGTLLLWTAVNWSRKGQRRTGRAAFLAVVIAVLGLHLAMSWVSAAQAMRDVDSRSQLIDAVNRLGSTETIEIPSDLHIHEQDLKRLKVIYSVAPISALASCSAASQGELIVLPLAMAQDPDTDRQKIDEQIYERAIDDATRAGQVLLHFDGSPLYFDGPTRSPGLMVVPLSTALCSRSSKP